MRNSAKLCELRIIWVSKFSRKTLWVNYSVSRIVGRHQ